MSIRLVRESSLTPNITNKDDVRMIRYAYGGYSGVVQGFGEELGYSVSESSLTVNSGRVVYQGWEVDIEGSGWSLNVSDLAAGTFYHAVFLEINALTETAKVKSVYDTSSYPTISPGDDLTVYPSGTANFLLYTVKSVNGLIERVSSEFSVIPYSKDKFEQVDTKISLLTERLESLGFKEGVATVTGATEIRSNSLIKQGKHVIFTLDLKTQNPRGLSVTIPEGFRPSQSITVSAIQSDEEIAFDEAWAGSLPGALFTVNPDGSVVPQSYHFFGDRLYIPNSGWKIS